MDVGPVDFKVAIMRDAEVPVVEKLPEAIVAGSTMIQFPPQTPPEIRASVALSLLAAQKVATHDGKVTTPEEWIQRHNEVLTNLNWVVEDQGVQEQEFKSINTAVHTAIIPFITTALTGVGAALIVTALEQLQEMDRNKPWITLFDNESRHFNITAYQFASVKVEGNQVHLRMAMMQFDATYGTTRVLFFELKRQKATFLSAWNQVVGEADLLIEMNSSLKKKLASLTELYIQSIPEEFWKQSKLRRASAMIA